MCWVMPPASPSTTFGWRIRSSSGVLPWSTWPITVTTGGRGRSVVVVLLVVLVVEEAGLERGLLLLAGVDQADPGADLGREQFDHVVAQRLGRRHHLALGEKEADDVAGRAVELRSDLLWRAAPLDDDLVVGNRRGRGHVRRDLDRLELLDVAPPPLRTALRGARPASRSTPRAATGGRAAGTGRAALADPAAGAAAVAAAGRPPPPKPVRGALTGR